MTRCPRRARKVLESNRVDSTPNAARRASTSDAPPPSRARRSGERDPPAETRHDKRHRRAQVTFTLAAYNIAAHVYPALAMPFSLGQVCFSTGAFWAAWCARDLVEVAVAQWT